MMNVLCITDYFLPGFKGGGPITTLANMRQQVSDEVTLSVFTRDRDLGSNHPYAECVPDCWTETPEGPVFYAGPSLFGYKGVEQVLSNRAFDLVYLNSFFGWSSSIAPYLSLSRMSREVPILIAPRGEFSPGALAVKKAKKKVFVKLMCWLQQYREVHWHASSEMEADDILRQLPFAAGKIHIAADPVAAAPPVLKTTHAVKPIDQLSIAFISRISPKKNLDGLLDFLSLTKAPVTLDIFGPIEDEAYWSLCERKIADLPMNVQVAWKGVLPPHEVSPTFANYDAFAFPTHGENFGHVIFEALRAGTPVLLSDQTPWLGDASGAVTVLPNAQAEGWAAMFERLAKLDGHSHSRLRLAALEYAQRYVALDESRAANITMFKSFQSPLGLV